jgi:hypothetical protein
MTSRCIDREDLGCRREQGIPRRPLTERVRLADLGKRGAMQIKGSDVAEFISALKKQAQYVTVVTQIPLLRAIAEELFLGPIEVAFQVDPEIADAHSIVFNVKAAGDLKEIASLRSAWYARTFGLLGANCDKVRLSIDIE